MTSTHSPRNVRRDRGDSVTEPPVGLEGEVRWTRRYGPVLVVQGCLVPVESRRGPLGVGDWVRVCRDGRVEPVPRPSRLLSPGLNRMLRRLLVPRMVSGD